MLLFLHYKSKNVERFLNSEKEENGEGAINVPYFLKNDGICVPSFFAPNPRKITPPSIRTRGCCSFYSTVAFFVFKATPARARLVSIFSFYGELLNTRGESHRGSLS